MSPRSLQAGYAVGRLAFGGGLIADPERVGRLFLGREAGRPLVRTGLRSYGTRDVILGGGGLIASARGDDAGDWVKAGIASDMLDAALQVAEWDELPRGHRSLGIAMALGAAAAGVAVLSARPSG